MSVSNTSACETFSKGDLTTIMVTKISTSAVSVVTCIVTLILMLCLKIWERFEHRLTIYLTTVAILLSLMYILQVIPVHVTSIIGLNHNITVTLPRSDGWNKACKGIAFVLQYTSWVMLLIICSIILFLIWSTHQSLLNRARRQIVCVCCSKVTERALALKKRTLCKCFSLSLLEFTGIVLTLGFPLLFTWVPFVTDSYGVGGAWCGIVIKRNSCINESLEQGLGMQIGIWYGPALATALLCTVGMIMVTCRMCCIYCRRSSNQQQIIDIVTDGTPLIVYLVAFNVITFVNAANLINHAISDNSNSKINMPLWIIHSFAEPGGTLMIPVAFALSQVIKHATRWYKRSRSATTVIVVPSEWTEVDALIPNRERTSHV